MNTLYPIYLKLPDRPVLVVGGGAVALRRVERLLEAGARIRLISPTVQPRLAELAGLGRLEWLERKYAEGDLEGFALVLAATGDPELVVRLRREATERGAWLSMADDEAQSDFHLPAVLTRGDLRIAISTAGTSPQGATQLRAALEQWLDTHPQVTAAALAVGRGSTAKSTPAPQPGKVFLVGAGPGDPGLVTLRAVELLESADVVYHDRLVSEAVLARIPPRVERVYVGKEAGCQQRAPIESLLIESARAGKRVVRLKGGDPLLFGRGGEEMAALAAAGIDFEVVPGVSALTAVPAAAGIPLTLRGVSREVIIRSGHPATGSIGAASTEHRTATTHVYFMAGTRLAQVAMELRSEGLAPTTPVAIIQRGTLPGQRTLFSSLAELPQLAERTPIDTPALLVVGDVVRAAGREGLPGLLDDLSRHDLASGLQSLEAQHDT